MKKKRSEENLSLGLTGSSQLPLFRDKNNYDLKKKSRPSKGLIAVAVIGLILAIVAIVLVVLLMSGLLKTKSDESIISIR